MDVFHKAAIEAGGTCHGKPGLRPEYHENYYGAFVLDLVGNNVELVSAQVPGDVFLWLIHFSGYSSSRKHPVLVFLNEWC